MKLSSLCFALGIAQLVACAPLPRILRIRLDGDSDKVHGAAAMLRGRSAEFSQKSASPAAVITVRHDGSHSRRPRMPNRHWDPELMPPPRRHWNRKHRNPQAGNLASGWGKPKHDHKPRPGTADDDDDSWELVDIIIGPPSSAPPSIPRHHGRFSRERNDILVVFLAVAFVVVVVVMEFWGSIFRR
jgi:hypothetical protein